MSNRLKELIKEANLPYNPRHIEGVVLLTVEPEGGEERLCQMTDQQVKDEIVSAVLYIEWAEGKEQVEMIAESFNL